MKFAALGRTGMLHDAVLAAVAAGHELVLVGTGPASPEYSVGEEEFRALAARHGVPFFTDTVAHRPEYVALARASGAEVALSMNWPTLIGSPMLAAFARGIVNAHAGALPRYRGNACPNWAILQGEKEVVLTLHQMVEALDAGPILLQRPCALGEESYIADVYAFMQQAVPAMFGELLDGLQRGSLRPIAQSEDPAQSLRCLPRMPRDHLIEWQQPAVDVARLVRASAEPFGGAFTFHREAKLTVWRARALAPGAPTLGIPGQVLSIDRARGEVAVLAGSGAVALQVVAVAGGARCAAAEAIRSTRDRLGLDLTVEVEALRARIAGLERELARRNAP